MSPRLRTLTFAVAGAAAALVAVAPAGAAPSTFPTNPNACVGASSTTANAQLQDASPSKFRSDQARADDGQPGRADSVAVIPQCKAAGLDRGN
ncbi:hypothetical protein [Williamsia serinedens]|uniref:Uncharacterized protein n=1 Tax=Williamsia serinedens TaxID=391736 RepID=A0ABT1H8D3_9NOCA|nr:hypothetical protein [Williamsia serinedens]MCP2162172.1 hypothetical protein [Williamsia serinedens]